MFTAGWTSEVIYTVLAIIPSLVILRLTLWIVIPQLKVLWGTEHLKQHCCDRQGFHVPKRLLKHSAWSVQLLAVRLFISTSWSSKEDKRSLLRMKPANSRQRAQPFLERGSHNPGPRSHVSTRFRWPGVRFRSVSSRPNPFSLLSLKAGNGVYCAAPHQAWLAAGAACASVCSALSHTQNLIFAVPQATA